MKFKEYNAGTDVIEYGEEGNEFFILLSGRVKVMIPNPKMKSWKKKMETYKTLRKNMLHKFPCLN